ncbi:MAG: nucleotidyltransferase family protein [Elusimicrobia bacterium]|nr:nucleotidyltransferase family protein [Elusimicrobiota bacterium]
MKALILAGGRGKRLGKVSEGINKCLLDVFGKPLIEYSFDCVSALDEINELIVMVGYRAEDIINKYGNNYKGKTVKYVIQWDRYGLVDAIEWGKELLGKDDFLLLLGDEFMLFPKHKDMIEKFKTEKLFGVCGVINVSDKEMIKKTYSIIQDKSGRIVQLIEKPKNPPNNIMGTGNCVFKNEILNYIPKTIINSKRGEKELPDLIQCAIDDGKLIKPFNICDKYVNVNTFKELDSFGSGFSHF